MLIHYQTQRSLNVIQNTTRIVSMYRGRRGQRNYGSGGQSGRGRGHNAGNWQMAREEGDTSSVPREDQSAGHSNWRGGRGGGSHPPAGLRGRDIGMFYAQKSRERKKRYEEENAISIEVNEQLSKSLTALIGKLESSGGLSATGIAQQSSSSVSDLLQEVNNARYNKYDDSVSSELSRDLEMDSSLLEDHKLRTNNSQSKHMLSFRNTLPTFKCKEELLQTLFSNQVVVISGETGCGKTTQVGQYILDEMIVRGEGSMCNVLCTQPRRISAVSVAERVADERCERIGANSVGYVIRLESKPPQRQRGAITFCTTGIVFQYLKSDPYLKRYSHIIVDEVHERDTDSDIIIAVLKDLMKVRPDLKIILMSATINADHFSRYFNNCPMFSIPGMTFPVTEYYLEDILEQLHFDFSSKEYSVRAYNRGPDRIRRKQWDSKDYEAYLRKYLQRPHMKYSMNTMNQLLKPESEDFESLIELTEFLIQEICTRDTANGAILIFVTGWDEISKLTSHLSSSGRFPASRFVISPVHSMMPTVNQREIFHRPPVGKRKIVISTNIAETSITIDDVVHVIDFGKIKMTNFDLKRNVESLDSEWVSRANAKQRKGRAGRIQEGNCYHLFTRARESMLQDFKKPEVLRKRLEEVILHLKILKLGDIRALFKRLLDPPSTKAVDLSFDRLVQLNALDDDENLTPLGFHLSHLPMDPHTGKMILMGAVFSCVGPVFSVAASLSFKEPFYIPLGKEKLVDRIRKEFSDFSKSDHWVIAKAIEGFEQACLRNMERDYCYRNFLSLSTCNLLVNFKKQFCEHLYTMKFLSSSNYKDSRSNLNSTNIALVKAVICSGLYPNIATVKPRYDISKGPPFPKLHTLEDGAVMIHKKSVNAEELVWECPFVVYHMKQKTKKINLYDTTMVSPYPLLFFGGNISFQKSGWVSVDGSFKFKTSQENYNLIQGLRLSLQKLLHQKICSPSPPDWNSSSLEGELLQAIRDLITSQYHQIMNPEQDDGEASDDDDY